MISSEQVRTKLSCYHCGEDCDTEVKFDNHSFCCDGCRTVYELLSDNNLCTYYRLNNTPGHTPTIPDTRFSILDDAKTAASLIRFASPTEVHVQFLVPGMHCSSCIWLLENLHELNPAVISSTVNFPLKEVTIVYKPDAILLSAVASLMTSIGYEPHVSQGDVEAEVQQAPPGRGMKIGVAGFCFGNIMMLSLPSYFGADVTAGSGTFTSFFGYLNLALAIPVLVYPAREFFVSAWKSIVHRHLNIDAPIALALAVTFVRSVYEILIGSGAGYLDSMTGIVFFMLIGRYVQQVTYAKLSFDRDYRSYFPVGVDVIIDGVEKSVSVSDLRPGDRMVIRHNGLIPADSILLSEHTYIDFSFVTGESSPVKRQRGDLVYAGGRQLRGAAELQVVKTASQSYLTRLWNNDSHSQLERTQKQTLVDRINRVFTITVLLIAASAAAFWSVSDTAKAIDAFTAVLIVACPCGLLLTSTFANGNMLRIFGKHKLYLKDADIIERISKVDTIVFDKTGTITQGSECSFNGSLNSEELGMVVSLASQSSHPLSRTIVEAHRHAQRYEVTGFHENEGKGLQGFVQQRPVVIGSERFVTGRQRLHDATTSCVFVSIDGEVVGYFSIRNALRPGLKELVKELAPFYEVYLLSGDNEKERERLTGIFREDRMLFAQAPEDKMNFIKALQAKGKKVMMVGDGLNDSGALKESDVGVAVSDRTNVFTPACDAMLEGAALFMLPAFIRFARWSAIIIATAFAISLVYNITGVYFSVRGELSPVIAAVLMPLSSVTIVVLSTLFGSLAGRGLTKPAENIQ